MDKSTTTQRLQRCPLQIPLATLPGLLSRQELSGSQNCLSVASAYEMSFALRQIPCRLGRLASSGPSTSPIATARYGRPLLRLSQQSVAPTSFARLFHISRRQCREQSEGSSPEPHQRGLNEAEQEARVKQNQVKRPWLREDADKPPAEQSLPPDPKAKGREIKDRKS